MEASAWFGGNGNTFGIRVGIANREQYFERHWTRIEVEMDGKTHYFALTAGFWNKCPEFRDKGEPVIRDWLRRHRTIKWEKGCPPRLTLIPIGNGKFQLLS